ncbi:MAG TPA: cell division protein FtsQ/DivIB [Bdellovibrionales bacterium]|nr:cell division protein FtsQ/DivIB [Bdellovibrionales bacterium]
MWILRALRWPITIFALIFLIGATVLALNPHWVRVETIEVTLSEKSKEDLLFQRIKTTLGQQLKPFEARYFWQVPLKKIFELTSRDKRVKSTAVFREFPSRLKIEIEPHTPVLAYLSHDGRVYPVATDATLLPAISVIDGADLPLLRGEELKDEIKLREAALELYHSIPNQGALQKKRVSEIVHTKKDGFKIYVSGEPGEKRIGEVQLGDSDFGPKISRVQKVLSYLESRDIKGRVIDARFSKKVVVRVRNNP